MQFWEDGWSLQLCQNLFRDSEILKGILRGIFWEWKRTLNLNRVKYGAIKCRYFFGGGRG